MGENNETPIESLESWLSGKPYWEQYIWKINLEKESLSDADIEQCYQYLSEHLGIIDKLPEEKRTISFKNEIMPVQEVQVEPVNLKLVVLAVFYAMRASHVESVKFCRMY